MRLDELAASFAAEDDGGPFAIALHREWANPNVTAYFTVPGEPRSKARARVAQRGGKTISYTPAETVKAERDVALTFRSAGGKGPDSANTFGVFVVFFCGTRQRRDVDNMLKLILDGLNKVAWADDSQVTEVSGRLMRGVGKLNARTEVIIYETVTEMTGGLMVTKPCKECGTPIRVYLSTESRTYCSPRCAGLAKRELPPIICEECGTHFQGASNRRFCSRECAATAAHESVSCPHCGITFRAKRAFSRVFCSKDCAYAARTKPAAPKPAPLAVDQLELQVTP